MSNDVKVTVDGGSFHVTIDRAGGEGWPFFTARIMDALRSAYCSAKVNPDFIGVAAAEPRKSLIDGVLKYVGCAYCGVAPYESKAPTLRQLISGGWTCPNCHEEHGPVRIEEGFIIDQLIAVESPSGSNAIPVATGPCIMEIKADRYEAIGGAHFNVYFEAPINIVEVVGYKNIARLLNGELRWELQIRRKGERRWLRLTEVESGRVIHSRALND